jgi:hypothetical protein
MDTHIEAAAETTFTYIQDNIHDTFTIIPHYNTQHETLVEKEKENTDVTVTTITPTPTPNTHTPSMQRLRRRRMRPKGVTLPHEKSQQLLDMTNISSNALSQIAAALDKKNVLKEKELELRNEKNKLFELHVLAEEKMAAALEKIAACMVQK